MCNELFKNNLYLNLINRTIRILIFIILATHFSKASEKWVLISSADKINVYYDEQSVIYNKAFDSFTVYVKYENIIADTLPTGKIKTGLYLLYNFYCSVRQTLLLEIKAVFSDGSYEYISPTSRKNTIKSDSAEEKIFEILCK